MQTWARWWQQWTQRSVRHAWGLAPHEGAWVLGGLARPVHHLAKIKTLVTLPAPVGAHDMDLGWLSPHLREHGRLGGGSRHRLNMALPRQQLHVGHIDFPADLPEEDWLYEVQLEAAQALQLAPDEVNFDFEPADGSDGPLRRVHWMACAQAHLAVLKNCTRAAGWRLAAVESEGQAAQRATRALRGGVASLLTQAPQDWQFLLGVPGGWAGGGDNEDAPTGADSEAAIEEALKQVTVTPGWPRLVAAGLALKAWQ